MPPLVVLADCIISEGWKDWENDKSKKKCRKIISGCHYEAMGLLDFNPGFPTPPRPSWPQLLLSPALRSCQLGPSHSSLSESKDLPRSGLQRIQTYLVLLHPWFPIDLERYVRVPCGKFRTWVCTLILRSKWHESSISAPCSCSKPLSAF